MNLFLNTAFSRDVTPAMLVSQNNETAAILVAQTSPLELSLYLMWELSFVTIHLHSSWPRGWKRSTECLHMTSRRPYWCSKQVLSELNSFLMHTLSFLSMNLHGWWSCEWKRSIRKQSTTAKVACVAGAWKKWVQDRTGHSGLEISWIEIITLFSK